MLVRKQYEFAINDPDLFAEFEAIGLKVPPMVDMPAVITPGHVKFSMNVVYDDAWVMDRADAPRRNVVVFMNGDRSGKMALTHAIVTGAVSKGQIYVEIFEANDSTVNWSDEDPTKLLGSYHSYTKVWMNMSDPDMESMYTRRSLELAQLLDILALFQARFERGDFAGGYPLSNKWILVGQSAGASKTLWLNHLRWRRYSLYNWAPKITGMVLSSLVITPVRFTTSSGTHAEFLRYDRFMGSFQRAFTMSGNDITPVLILQNAGDDAANKYMREINQMAIPDRFRDKIWWYSDASRGHGGDWTYIMGQVYLLNNGLPLTYVDGLTGETKPMLNLKQLVRLGITKRK